MPLRCRYPVLAVTFSLLSGGALDSGANDERINTKAPNDVKRLKTLELENAKLKRLLAERDLEVDLMREVNRKKW